MKFFFKLGLMTLGMMTVVSCGNNLDLRHFYNSANSGDSNPNDLDEQDTGSSLPFAEDTTVRALNEYCRACHGIGDLRFIYGEDRDEIWKYIFSNKAPRSGKLWSEAIYEVLNWPSDTPPSFDNFMSPPDRDWMPKGAKRLYMAEDKVNGVSVRKFILKTIEDGQKKNVFSH